MRSRVGPVDFTPSNPMGNNVATTSGPGLGYIVGGTLRLLNGKLVVSLVLELGSPVGFELGTATVAAKGRCVGSLNFLSVLGPEVRNALFIVVGLTLGPDPRA